MDPNPKYCCCSSMISAVLTGGTDFVISLLLIILMIFCYVNEDANNIAAFLAPVILLLVAVSVSWFYGISANNAHFLVPNLVCWTIILCLLFIYIVIWLPVTVLRGLDYSDYLRMKLYAKNPSLNKFELIINGISRVSIKYTLILWVICTVIAVLATYFWLIKFEIYKSMKKSIQRNKKGFEVVNDGIHSYLV